MLASTLTICLLVFKCPRPEEQGGPCGLLRAFAQQVQANFSRKLKDFGSPVFEFSKSGSKVNGKETTQSSQFFCALSYCIPMIIVGAFANMSKDLCECERQYITQGTITTTKELFGHAPFFCCVSRKNADEQTSSGFLGQFNRSTIVYP